MIFPEPLQDTARLVRLLDAIYEISRAANQSHDPESLFKRIHEIVKQLIPADNLYIALYDEAKQMLSFPYYVDEFDDPPPPAVFGDGLTERLILTGNPMLLTPTELYPDRNAKESPVINGTPPQYWLGVPLRTAEDKIIGALVVQTYDENIQYSPTDQELLVFVSTQIAMSIAEKNAESALRESQTRLSLAVSSADVGLWEWHMPDGSTDADDFFSRILGYEPEDWPRNSTEIASFVHPEDLQASRNALIAHLKGQVPLYEGEYRLRDMNGAWRWVSVIGRAVEWNELGRVTRLTGVLRDVTEQRLAAEARLELQFRNLAQKLAVGIAIHQDGKLHFANEAACQLTGYSPDELRSLRALAQILVPDHRRKVVQAAREYLHPGETSPRFEVQLRRRDGQLIWVDFSTGMIEIDGRPAGLTTFYDITERKQAERLQQTLYDIAASALQAADLPALYSSIHKAIGELLPARNLFIAIQDDHTAWLRFPYFVDELDDAPFEFPPQPISKERPARHGLTEYLLRQQRSLLIDRQAVHHLAEQGEITIDHVGKIPLQWLGAPLRRADGSVFGALVIQTYRPGVQYTISDQQLLGFVSTQVALALERRMIDEALGKSEMRYRMLFERLPVGVFHYDQNLIITAANQRMAEMINFDQHTLIGSSLREIKDQHILTAVESALHNQEGYYEGEFQYNDGGRPLYVMLRTAPVSVEQGMAVGGVGIVQDLTERRRMQEEMRYQEMYDSLTNLPNRTLLIDRLGQALATARRNQESLAVVFVDLDRFKDINDSLGHPVGDEVLVLFSQRLNQAIRSSDTLARVGGDDFVILLSNLRSERSVLQVIQKIRSGLQSPLLISGRELYIDTTVGFAIFPQDGQDVHELLRNADNALAFAKTHSKGSVQRFLPAMSAIVNERLAMSNQLRRAIEQDELVLFYQPQIDLKTGQWSGVEALLRWQHPQSGLLSPASFIPLAEETGLVDLLGKWVLRQVCFQCRKWRSTGWKDLHISLNVSPIQFTRPDFTQEVLRSLAMYDLSPDCLTVEITESVFMQNLDEVASRLRELRQMGLHIHLDDFGTAYSSLSYLRSLPLDCLKIDKTFVRDLSVQSKDGYDPAALVKAIVDLGHSLNLTVLGEGVETAEQLKVLQDLGCDQGQGYYFARPMPSDEVLGWMSRFDLRSKQG